MSVLLFLDKLIDAFPLLSRGWHSISARAGYAAYRGKAWGRVAQAVIDRIMGSATHCYDAAVSEGLIESASRLPPARRT